jgi:hypothetical protein
MEGRSILRKLAREHGLDSRSRDVLADSLFIQPAFEA